MNIGQWSETKTPNLPKTKAEDLEPMLPEKRQSIDHIDQHMRNTSQTLPLKLRVVYVSREVFCLAKLQLQTYMQQRSPCGSQVLPT